MKRRNLLAGKFIALPLTLVIANVYAVDLTRVLFANTKTVGVARANALSPDLVEIVVAQITRLVFWRSAAMPQR